jgi:hypothetical protein
VSTSIFRTQKACTAGARRRRGRWAVPTKTNKCPPSLRPSLRCPSFAAPPPQVRHRAALWCGVSPSLRVVSTVVSPSSIRRVPLPTYMHEKISFELLLERSAPLWPTSPNSTLRRPHPPAPPSSVLSAVSSILPRSRRITSIFDHAIRIRDAARGRRSTLLRDN